MILFYLRCVQALRNIGPAGKVASYRALWLRLSKIARDTGIANCYTFTFINLYLFLIITLSIYGLLSQISDGFGTKDIGLAMTAICSIFLLFFICDEAHYASHNVSYLQYLLKNAFCKSTTARFHDPNLKKQLSNYKQSLCVRNSDNKLAEIMTFIIIFQRIY